MDQPTWSEERGGNQTGFSAGAADGVITVVGDGLYADVSVEVTGTGDELPERVELYVDDQQVDALQVPVSTFETDPITGEPLKRFTLEAEDLPPGRHSAEVRVLDLGNSDGTAARGELDVARLDTGETYGAFLGNVSSGSLAD